MSGSLQRRKEKSKEEVNEQFGFGRKMNQDANENRKLFLEGELRKCENCSRIKDENGRLPLEEFELQKIWKEYFENIYNISIL